ITRAQSGDQLRRYQGTIRRSLTDRLVWADCSAVNRERTIVLGLGREIVRARTLLLVMSAGIVLSASTPGNTQNSVALTGKVSSAQEATMEGVLVSAKLDGSNVTTTVATNAQGIYSFPAGRLAPGRYALSIRAAGYRLDG